LVGTRKTQQNEKTAGKLNAKAERQIRKNKPKMSKFTQKHAEIVLCNEL